MVLSFYTCHQCGGISINECVRRNEDYELLNYALKKMRLSRDTLQKEYFSK